MTYFVKNGNRFMVTPNDAVDIHDELPPATYTVKADSMTGALFLETISGFSVPSKLYGDTEKYARRILSTFKSRGSTTGVLLTGDKGSGKTMLAKLLSKVAATEKMPTIVINEPWSGEAFNSFMQQIEQPVVVIFDEFEKVYDRDEQEKMLTLLDGVYPSQKLYVLTCNDRYRINEHMQNRPGRLYYRIDYTGLDADFIREYANDNLDNKTHIETIVKLASAFNSFNFDILKALVEEMNRYDESPQDALKFLNASPADGDDMVFDVSLAVSGATLSVDDLTYKTWQGNPFDEGEQIRIDYYINEEKDKEALELDDLFADSFGDGDRRSGRERRKVERINFGIGDLAETQEGVFIYRKGKHTLTLTRSRKTQPNWYAF